MTEYPKKDFSTGRSIVLLYGGYQNNCNITLSMLYDIEKRHSNINFIKVNTSKYYKVKEKYQIHILPTILYFRDGNLIDKLKGPFNYHQIEQMIQRS